MPAIDRALLDDLPRDELVVEARRIGVKRPEVMTRVELVDEIVRLGTPNPVERKKARGWFGIARDLIASAVEQGLNLPDAAALIRGDIRYEPLRTPQSPVATVTLAEIYGAQGHFGRALGILDEVLTKEPEHHVARTLRERIQRERAERKGDAPRVPPDSVEEPVPQDAPDEPEAATLPPPPPRDDDAIASTLPIFDDPAGPDQPDARTLMPPPPAASNAQVPGVLLSPQPSISPSPASNGAAPKGTEDAIVLVRSERGDGFVAHYERASHHHEEGTSLVVRVVEMRLRPWGAERIVRDLPADGARGTIAVDGVEAESVVRAALGATRGGTFRARAVAIEAHMGEGGPEILWSPRRASTSLAVLGAAVMRLSGLPNSS